MALAMTSFAGARLAENEDRGVRFGDEVDPFHDASEAAVSAPTITSLAGFLPSSNISARRSDSAASRWEVELLATGRHSGSPR